jgi:hypothetical protein
MVVPYTVEHKVWSEHNNQSLVGVVYRLTTHSPSASTYDANKQHLPTEYANVWDLDREQAHLLVLGCELLFAGVVMWCCRTPPGARTGWRVGAEFAIVTLGMLLFSERTWKHHCVTLIFPFAVLCYYLATANLGRWLTAYVGGSLAAVALLMTAPSLSGVNEWGHWLDIHGAGSIAAVVLRVGGYCDALAKGAEVYGVYVIGYLILLAALAITLRRAQSAELAVTSPKPKEDAAAPLAA